MIFIDRGHFFDRSQCIRLPLIRIWKFDRLRHFRTWQNECRGDLILILKDNRRATEIQFVFVIQFLRINPLAIDISPV